MLSRRITAEFTALTFRAAFFVWTRGSGSESLDEKEAIDGACFLPGLSGAMAVRSKVGVSSQPLSLRSKISFSF